MPSLGNGYGNQVRVFKRDIAVTAFEYNVEAERLKHLLQVDLVVELRRKRHEKVDITRADGRSVLLRVEVIPVKLAAPATDEKDVRQHAFGIEFPENIKI